MIASIFEDFDLDKIFLDQCIHIEWRYNSPYFIAADCEKIFKFCESNDIAILGIDGFEINGKYWIALLDYIYDASSLVGVPWAEFMEKSINGARLFINEVKSDEKYFEFVFCKKIKYQQNIEYKIKNYEVK